MLEFETLNELIGKNITMTIELKKAHDLPEKYSFKTMAKYHWQDEEYETKVVAKKTTPNFDYAGVHSFTVTDDMIQSLMYNTLTIALYGMIESKKDSLIKAKHQGIIEQNEDGEDVVVSRTAAIADTGNVEVDKRMRDLEK